MVPDRDQVTMTSPFMSAYSLRVIQVCHKRNILAIGGMAAQIPIKNDEEANKIAFEKVKADKEREVKNGHDGTWVAHPGLVSLAMKVFDENMPTKNQMHIKRGELNITEEQLLELPKGTITENGVRKNINVGILYLESWLNGTGAAALYNLMEDAATAEISRAELWQWIKHHAVMSDGRKITSELYKNLRAAEFERLGGAASGRMHDAAVLLDQLVENAEFEEFLTIPAYEKLNTDLNQ